MSDGDFAEGMNRLEELIERVEETCSPETLPLVRELVRTLLDVHRGGLEALLRAVEESGRGVDVRAIAATPAVGSLLLLHDLHPDALPERVRAAVRDANDAAPGGATAEMVRMDGADVYVVVRGKTASALVLRKALERAVCERAPDATLHVEEVLTPGEPVSGLVSGDRLIPVERLRARSGGGP